MGNDILGMFVWHFWLIAFYSLQELIETELQNHCQQWGDTHYHQIKFIVTAQFCHLLKKGVETDHENIIPGILTSGSKKSKI